MALKDIAAMKTMKDSVTALKPYLESLHARLELMNEQLARIEARLHDTDKRAFEEVKKDCLKQAEKALE